MAAGTYRKQRLNLDPVGLVDRITAATYTIDFGRKGYAMIGNEREGRISYETGIAEALAAFKEAQTTTDPQTIILVEFTFLVQEQQLCDKSDTDTLNSLTQAIQSFDDAFLVLKTVENKTQYQGVENATPHNGKYRVKGCPKDSFHIACIAHKTRLQNILRTPGLDPIEKALLKQRLSNLPVAQEGYVDRQEKALT